MNCIKDKEKTISELNQLISGYGPPQELAKSIDNILFDWITSFLSSGDCAGDQISRQVSDMKAIRDFMQAIELK